MTRIKEIDFAREKLTLYISSINRLETEFEKSRKETVQVKKSLTDAQKEILAMNKKIKVLTQDNENFHEAVKQFKLLGEKDKKKMDKMATRIEQLEEKLET